MRSLLGVWLMAIGWVTAVEPARLGGSWGELNGQPLVPAVLGIWTDQTGAGWNLQDHGILGRIGSGMMNAGEQVWIDGVSFACEEPLMTRDGAEWVFPADRLYSGLAVSRRVKLDRERGVIRYLEVLRNPSTDPVTVLVELRSQYNGNIAEVRTSEGRISPIDLVGEETGVSVVPAPSVRDRLFVYGLGSGEGAARVAISNPSRFALHVRYTVTVPAGRTTMLWHALVQAIPGEPERDMGLDSGQITGEERAQIANLPAPQASEARQRLIATIQREWGELPAEDTLWLDASSKLVGHLTGQFEWPLEAVVSIEPDRVRLRNGEVWRGTLRSKDLSFTPSAGDGTAISLADGRMLRCVRGGVPAMTAWPEQIAGYLETQEGERFVLAELKSTPAGFTSPWGTWTGTLDDVAAFAWKNAEPWLTRRDGTQVRAFSVEESWTIQTAKGAKMTVPVRKVRSFVHRDGLVPGGPVIVRLKEGEVLAGDWGRDVLQIPPATLRTAAIRQLVRLNDGVRVELWDGGAIQGPLTGGVIPIRVSGQEFQVGLADLVAVTSRHPERSAAEAAEIERQIAKLGSPQWAERESATEWLRGLGESVRAELERAFTGSSEPEVRHRLQQLLGRG